MLLACPSCATVYDVQAAVIGDNGRSLRCARCETVWFATRAQELLVAAPAPQPAATEAAALPPALPHDDRDDDLPEPSPQYAEALARQLADDAPPLAPIGSDASTTQPAVPPPGSSSLTAAGEDIETFARRRTQETNDRTQRWRKHFGAPTIIAILAVIISGLIAWRIPIVQHAPQTASFYSTIGLAVNLRDLVFRDVRTMTETREGVPSLVVDGTIISIGRAPVEVPRLKFALRDRSGQEIYSWTAIPEQTVLAPGATLPFRSRLASPPSEGHDVIVRFITQRDTTDGAR